ncbi:hypothetical protein [Haloglomus salinum]|uniref:hypothetical protein n=1 Tax=Haloglomus salinum TaxID=2962673 RepID=UPI0020CA1FEF|nr:hypothetical protein [Haloglomus salinum]
MIWVGVFAVLAVVVNLSRNALQDGFNVGDVGYVGMRTAAEVPVLTYIASVVVRAAGIDANTVPFVGFSTMTVVVGLLLGLRFYVGEWPAVVADADVTEWGGFVRLSGLFATVAMAGGISFATYWGLVPDAGFLERVYAAQVNLVLLIVDNPDATQGLVSRVTVLSFLVGILETNLLFGLKAMVVGAVGALYQRVLLPLLFVFAAAIMLLFGPVVGTYIRLSIQTGAPIFGPLFGWLAGFGMLAVGHTYWEFAGVLAMGVAGTSIVMGILRDRYIAALYALAAVVVVVVAAVIEITIDPFLVSAAKGVIAIDPQFVDHTVNTAYFIGVVSTFVTGVAMLAFVVMTTERVLGGNTS